MGDTDDDIYKFITAAHGAKSGRALAKRIFIPLGVIMHLKALRFELDDTNKFSALLDAAMIAYIYIPTTCYEEHF